MKYLDAKFSSRPASREYRDGWERTFGVVEIVPGMSINLPYAEPLTPVVITGMGAGRRKPKKGRRRKP